MPAPSFHIIMHTVVLHYYCIDLNTAYNNPDQDQYAYSIYYSCLLISCQPYDDIAKYSRYILTLIFLLHRYYQQRYDSLQRHSILRLVILRSQSAKSYIAKQSNNIQLPVDFKDILTTFVILAKVCIKSKIRSQHCVASNDMATVLSIIMWFNLVFNMV